MNNAYQTTHQVITRYFTTVEARERAIREANPDQVARIEQSLTQKRKAFVKAIQGFILDNSDLQNKAATTFSFTGVADATLIVQKNAQGQWQVQNMKFGRGNFWNAPAPVQ